MPPWTTLVRLPWTTILRETATLLKQANDLRAARMHAPVAAPASNEIEALRRRVADLEEQQQADADIIQQLATEITRIAAAAEASADKVRQAQLLAMAGIAFGVLATLLAWLR